MIIKYINPEGNEVEVPEADAEHFDAKGWERVDGGSKKKASNSKTK